MKKIEAIQKEFGTQIARAALDMQAIKLDPANPFRLGQRVSHAHVQ